MSQKSDKTIISSNNNTTNNNNSNNENDDVVIGGGGVAVAVIAGILNNHNPYDTDNLDMINDLLPMSERNLTVENNNVSREALENTRLLMDSNRISGTTICSNIDDHPTNTTSNTNNNEATVHINEHAAVNKREENPFSFKHFLKSDNSSNSQNKTAYLTTTTTTTITSTTTPHIKSPIPSTSTGARPKILQHPPTSQQYQSYSNNNNNNTNTIESTKMKRSPRFSSFDSHASLTKFAASTDNNSNITNNNNNNNNNHNYNRSSGDSSLSMTNLFHNGINEFDSNTTIDNNNNDYDNDIINNGLRFTTLSLNAAAEMLGDKNVSPSSSCMSRNDTSTKAINKPRSISQQNLYNNHHHHHHNHHQNNNCTGRNNNNNNNNTTNEFSAALPDFVQDHIVLEQWYCSYADDLGTNDNESLHTHPSTSIASVISSQQHKHHNQNIPFDLMYDHGVTRHRRNSSSTAATTTTTTSTIGGAVANSTMQFDLPSNISKNVPLDLPNPNTNSSSFTNYHKTLSFNNNINNINTNNVSNGVMSGFAVADDDDDDNDNDDDGIAGAQAAAVNSGPIGSVPLPTIEIVNRVLSNDIPLDLTSQYASAGGGGGGGGGAAVIAPQHQNNVRQQQMPSNVFDQVQQSLPDFLSDGPIHSSSRLADVTLDLPLNDNLNKYSSNAMRTNREASEIDKLRFELFYSRQEVYEQAAKIQELEQSLEIKRQQQTESSTNLDNLYKSNKRAEAAQKQVARLKLLNSDLTSQIEVLKRENELLKEEGAVGGIIIEPITSSTASSHLKSRHYEQNQQISRELLAAALNAECNLRQLLTGVENLRSIAHRIDDNVNLTAPSPPQPPQPPLSQETRQSGSGGVGVGGSSHNTIRIQNTSYNIEDFSDCDDDDDEDFTTGPAL